MTPSNYSNICRTCLSQNSAVKPVFSTEEVMQQEVTLCDMLLSCTSITIIRDDGLPDSICLNCLEELRRAFSFKKMCENSETTLRRCINVINPVAKVENSNYDIKAESNMPVEENQISWDYDNLNEPADDGEENLEVNLKDEKQDSDKIRKSYKCEECREECLGLASYWKHMYNTHGRNFKCEICEKEFKSPSLLAHHKASHNKTGSTSKRTKNKTGIIKTRNLPRTCDICNKTFRFHSNLERHKLIHTGEKPYLCNVCGKGFGQMSYLKIHSFIHTGEKPYKCQMCEKSFAAPGTLLTHVRIHTGERPHVCKICGKDFPQSGYLSAHIRTHTGEKPVECKVCHRRFNQSGRLVIHMRIHSGEKPYSCKECGRSFAVKGTLKKHIRTHTGERPYVCSVCGQAFAQSGTLATHMKVHRSKQ